MIPGFLKPDANFGKPFLRLVSGKRLSLQFGIVTEKNAYRNQPHRIQARTHTRFGH